MGYEFIEVNSDGNHVYELKVEIYRDCYNSDVDFDPVIDVGVYEATGSNPDRLDVIQMNLDGSVSVDPPFADDDNDCDFDPDVCVERGWYEQEIILPPSSHGYHFIHERCCRNDNINLTDMMGQAYHTTIPPTDFQHSSPDFEADPIPYVCRGVMTSLDNEAFDPDGDSLSYHFNRPFHGGSEAFPNPTPPITLSLPVDEVIYSQGHSVNQPFGSGGEANLFETTGLTQVEAPQTGFYAISVEVRSYRNGQYLSSVYRDLQIIVIDCPDNPVPEIQAPLENGQAKEQFFIEAGETLDFDIQIDDPGNNNMDFSFFGEVFGDIGSVAPPHASLEEQTDVSFINSNFVWESSCDQAREAPYTFTIEAKDDGCPPQTLIHNYEIFVEPPPEPENLSGPEEVCQFGEDDFSYTVDKGNEDNEAIWEVEGGVITEENDNEITVRWEDTEGTVTYQEENQFGCSFEELSMEVDVILFPSDFELSELEFCSTEEVWIGPGEANFSSRLNFSWEPSGNLEFDDSLNALADYSDNPPDEPLVKDFELHIYYDECTLTVNQTATIYPGLYSSPIIGPRDACAGDLYDYNFVVSEITPNTDYYWEVNDGELKENYNDSIRVGFNEEGRQMIRLSGENQYGCRSDTTSLPVDVEKSFLDTIKGPPVVCPHNDGISYEVDAMPGATYHWSIENGEINSGQGDSIVYVNWGEPGAAQIRVVEELASGCKGDTVTFDVLLDHELETSEIMGPDSVCANEGNVWYQVFETENSEYEWQVDNGSILAGQGTHQILVQLDNPGTAQIRVFEESYDPVNDEPCMGQWVEKDIEILDFPDPYEFPDPFMACENDTISIGPENDLQNEYFWELEGAAFFEEEETSVRVMYNQPGSYEYEVYRVNEAGCTSTVSNATLEVVPEPETSKIMGDTVVCDSNDPVTYHEVEGMEGSEFMWSVDGGTLLNEEKPPMGRKNVEIEWEGHGVGTVSVYEISSDGCSGPVVEQDVYTDLPDPELNYVTTLPEDDSRIEVDWKLNNDDFYDRYFYLFKSPEGNGNLPLDDSLIYPNDNFEDVSVRTGQNSYEYQIGIKNLCGDSLFTNNHKSILLEGEKQGEEEIEINWNDYLGWGNEINNYTLYRRIDESEEYQEFETYSSVSPGTERHDVFEDGYEQCYRVKADHATEEYESWSNEICFEFDAVIHIPNAFSPNDDEVNDVFEVTAFNLKDFRMTIFNRWGQRIFESDDIDKGWDGTLNGEDVQEGSYLYLIEYESIEGKSSESGTLTLIR